MDFLSAIYRYCNYQERSHQEVRNKLYELGAKKTEVEEIIAQLIEKDMLNEERFAKAIARGKFRLKKWGRVKISNQLKQHKISEYCIKAAMKEITPEEYDHTLNKIAEKKWAELDGEKSKWIKQYKLNRYLMQKGYESDLVKDVMNKLINAAK